MNLREHLRKRQVSGLLLIAAGIMLAALLCADLHSVFPHGWWRFW
jgi:hypothetical protein